MGFIELILLAIGLAADAFAVSVADGICAGRGAKRLALVSASCFGLFQGIMPVIGFAAGHFLGKLISPIDHYIIFLILGVLGGHMIYDTLKNESTDSGGDFSGIDYRKILAKGVATSIDALVVGIGLAAVGASIVFSAAAIACITFALCLIGFFLGGVVGAAAGKRAKILGGVILIGIGAKVLIEHLINGI